MPKLSAADTLRKLQEGLEWDVTSKKKPLLIQEKRLLWLAETRGAGDRGEKMEDKVSRILLLNCMNRKVLASTCVVEKHIP